MMKKYRFAIFILMLCSSLAIAEEIKDHAAGSVIHGDPAAECYKKQCQPCRSSDLQFEIAESIGIRVPKTIVPADMKQAIEQIKGLVFPVVLKASIKPQDKEQASQIHKISYAKDWTQLQQLLDVYYQAGVLPIIQEMIF